MYTVYIFMCRKVRKFKIPDILPEEILTNHARVEFNCRLLIFTLKVREL
jgi:hypothetical protein